MDALGYDSRLCDYNADQVSAGNRGRTASEIEVMRRFAQPYVYRSRLVALRSRRTLGHRRRREPIC